MTARESYLFGSRILRSGQTELNLVSSVFQLSAPLSETARLAVRSSLADLGLTEDDLDRLRREVYDGCGLGLPGAGGAGSRPTMTTQGVSAAAAGAGVEWARITLISHNGVLEYLGPTDVLQNPAMRIEPEAFRTRLLRALVGETVMPAAHPSGEDGTTQAKGQILSPRSAALRMLPAQLIIVSNDTQEGQQGLDELVETSEAESKETAADSGVELVEDTNYNANTSRPVGRQDSNLDQVASQSIDPGCKFVLKFTDTTESRRLAKTLNSRANGQAAAESLVWSQIRERANFEPIPLAVMEIVAHISGSQVFFVHFRIPLFRRRDAETRLGVKRILDMAVTLQPLLSAEAYHWEKQAKIAEIRLETIEEELRKMPSYRSSTTTIVDARSPDQAIDLTEASDQSRIMESTKDPSEWESLYAEDDDQDMKRLIDMLAPLFRCPPSSLLADPNRSDTVSPLDEGKAPAVFDADFMHAIEAIRKSRNTRKLSWLALENLVELEKRLRTLRAVEKELNELLEHRLKERRAAVREWNLTKNQRSQRDPELKTSASSSHSSTSQSTTSPFASNPMATDEDEDDLDRTESLPKMGSAEPLGMTALSMDVDALFGIRDGDASTMQTATSSSSSSSSSSASSSSLPHSSVRRRGHAIISNTEIDSIFQQSQQALPFASSQIDVEAQARPRESRKANMGEISEPDESPLQAGSNPTQKSRMGRKPPKDASIMSSLR